MSSLVRVADNKGRVSLPGFANATVILEPAAPMSIVCARRRSIPADDLRFFPEEEMPVKLSKKDAQRVLEALRNPPQPNEAARKAAKRFKQICG